MHYLLSRNAMTSESTDEESFNWGKTAAEYALHAQGFTLQYIRSAVDDAVVAAATTRRPINNSKKNKTIFRCLDIASGTGAATLYLIEALSHRFSGDDDFQVEILATDLNQGMLSQLESKKAEITTKYPNCKIDTKVLDMDSLEGIEANSMDIVTMTFGIMFSEKPEQALQEVQRVLAPDGALELEYRCG